MTDPFIPALPKAELHVHLEGTLEPELLFALAARNGVDLPWPDVEQVRAAYEFTGLEHFLALLFRAASVLRTGQDFYDLAHAYLARADADGVRRAEMFLGVQTFLDAGVPIADQLDPVLAAIDDARAECGIDGALLVTSQRHRTQGAALEVLDLIRPWGERVLGVGLGAAERGNPPAKFADYYATARARGYRTTIHAGEDGPAEYVREALDVCRPDRIDHGVAAIDDPELVARLRDAAVPLTVCPLSNVALRVVPSMAAHPLRALVEAGVLVTVNSDDPPYFGGYLNDNYEAVRAHLGLGRAALAELARNGFRASFDDPARIAAHVADVDRCAAAFPEP
ncbi:MULTISPECIES: adenosine deaminase [unclassified Saccharopolyspora]|uniref:adenosine deaminase n=1 Tax=unclassified Saccharopolyspora TaxID=2646250 RepID=UPI001CD564F7|nr:MULTISPECIES: adenosine deaminase [unclassified Saccharopolyspora]MCA1184929.1 adenosine deaminase [Saccharopolyspora sp. 6T]MCA1190650.1 adenosine deaminase [Saccharopolyspora sp. 6V]MCA1229117.1 adenosine deaminase [Saccharopolyspora sp. 6M]MCA1279905.1 adenosine deaminase [Saccharopolyspora sp. 7B]